MAEVVLFHHVQGLTEGVRELARRLGEGGHTVHTPDLFEGELPAQLEDGIAFTRELGDELLGQRADEAVAGLPDDLVYAGISYGVMLAQRMAQTRPAARGALFYEACLPVTGEWAVGPWPEGLALQVHGHADDEFFAREGDLDAAREIAASLGPELGEVFTYPGDGHLFVDSSLPTYDAEATAHVVERSRAFLDRVS